MAKVRLKRRPKKPVKRAQKRKGSRFWWVFWRLGALSLLVFVGYLFYLNIIVVSRFEGQKWELPAHVYSRPLELYSGLELRQSDLLWELDQLGYRSVDQVALPGQYQSRGNRVDLYSREFSFWDGDGEEQLIQLGFSGNRINSLKDGQGRDVALIRLEPMRIGGIYPDAMEDRLLLSLDQIPELVQQTLLLVEDRAFYDHLGVSPRAILRAMMTNLQSGAAVQGGSTLTQQLVKNFYLTSERTLSRKAREALMAILLELQFSKEEILEAYFNEIYFGQSGRRAINGIGLASQYYFRQPLDELDVHQVAFLIGMIKGPANYNPWSRIPRATERRNLVLQLMDDNQLISAEQAERYSGLPLGVADQPGRTLNPYPGYMRLVLQQLQRDYSADQLEKGGLKIFTAFDPLIQRRAESSVSSRLEAIEAGYSISQDSLQSAVIVAQVGSGEIVALVGDRNPGFDGFNRALEARRPIGSLIKPVLYLTALNNPREYALPTLINDTPIALTLPNGDIWAPENYEHKSHGQVPLYQAMAYSYNQAAANLGLEIGVDAVLETLSYLGVDHEMPELPSMLLGAGELTPFQVATVYHTIAAEGFYTPLGAIRGVYTAQNEPLQRFARQVEQRIDPRAIHLLQYALQVVMREGTGRQVYRQFPDSVRLAGKTGTTNDLRDSWFAGFGGTYLSVVWVGRDDNGKTPLTGASGALSIWQSLMYGLEQRPVPFVRPSGIEYFWVEPENDQLSAEGCPGAVYLPFVSGSEPSRRSPCLPDLTIRDRIRDFLGL